MPKFVIERGIPGAGDLTHEELQGIATTSNEVLSEMPEVQWVHSYVTSDKIYCVYNAPDADQVREHARRGGFPADTVSPVSEIIDPVTPEVAVRA